MVSKWFVSKRLLLLIPVLIGIGSLVFAILHLSGGDPARAIAGRRATQEQVEIIRHQMGLDRPIWVQYFDFLVNAAQFDFGQSYHIQRGKPVTDIISGRFIATLELAIYGQLIGIFIGIPVGVLSAVKQNSITDHLSRVGALTGISVPIFWSGPMLILVFGVMYGIFPTSGRIDTTLALIELPEGWQTTGFYTIDTLLIGNFEAFFSVVSHLILPATVIGIYSTALISRMMRSSMLEIVRKDYIRTARAKGQGTKITLLKHGFKNALIPVITIIGIQFGTLLGGAVLTEEVFDFPGIGKLIVDAINAGDYPVVQGAVLVFALLFTLVNLFVDITYSYLDPRIQQ